MKIADRIQILRKSKGLSQEELADIIGVSRQAVSKWESEQSVPDLDKVILISDYFNVTTDYLLKGLEPIKPGKVNNNALSSKVLYVSSTALIAIGLLCAFASWYKYQSADNIWGSMIIQTVGISAYFIGKIISREKAALIIRWLNVILILFMPLSMIVAAVFNRVIAPYLTDYISGSVFAILYLTIAIFLWFLFKKRDQCS